MLALAAAFSIYWCDLSTCRDRELDKAFESFPTLTLCKRAEKELRDSGIVIVKPCDPFVKADGE